jgi:hypothetical protein
MFLAEPTEYWELSYNICNIQDEINRKEWNMSTLKTSCITGLPVLLYNERNMK